MKFTFTKVSSETIAWHISNAKFSKFDNQMAAQGIFWFATDREHLLEIQKIFSFEKKATQKIVLNNNETTFKVQQHLKFNRN